MTIKRKILFTLLVLIHIGIIYLDFLFAIWMVPSLFIVHIFILGYLVRFRAKLNKDNIIPTLSKGLLVLIGAHSLWYIAVEIGLRRLNYPMIWMGGAQLFLLSISIFSYLRLVAKR